MQKKMVMWGVLGVVVVGLGVYFAKCIKGGCRSTRTGEAAVSTTVLPGAEAMRVDIDSCLSNQVSGEFLLISVSASTLFCEETDGSCPSFERVIPVPVKAFRETSWHQPLEIDLTRVARAVGTELNYLVVSVSVCEDKNHNASCDETPLAQVLRMTGRYLASTDPSGKLALDLFASSALCRKS